jgi:hypothetical protein
MRLIRVAESECQHLPKADDLLNWLISAGCSKPRRQAQAQGPAENESRSA